MSRPTRAATATRGFANSIAALKQSCRRRCGRRTRRANGCSSITRATGSRSSLTGSPGKSAWRRSSWPCSAPRASPSRTRAGRRRSPTGSTPMRAREAIGGVPQLLVPDNTKTAVIKACLYDLQVNRTYAEMAAHYGAAILSARPRRPRDKAKVEQAVHIVERWLLGRLRHRTFYSLADVNAAIADLMTHLNEQCPIRRLGVTRRQLPEEVDRPALR